MKEHPAARIAKAGIDRNQQASRATQHEAAKQPSVNQQNSRMWPLASVIPTPPLTTKDLRIDWTSQEALVR